MKREATIAIAVLAMLTGAFFGFDGGCKSTALSQVIIAMHLPPPWPAWWGNNVCNRFWPDRDWLVELDSTGK